MRKRFFLILLCLLFCAVVKAQTYTISEAQIQRLETILQNYKSDRQTREKTLSELKSEVEILRTESENLLNNLKAEREQTRNLRNSLTTLEARTAQTIASAQATIQSQQKQIAETKEAYLKEKIKARNFLIALIVTGLLLIICLIATGFLFVKRLV